MVIFSYILSTSTHRPEEGSAIPRSLTLAGTDGGDHDGGDGTAILPRI